MINLIESFDLLAGPGGSGFSIVGLGAVALTSVLTSGLAVFAFSRSKDTRSGTVRALIQQADRSAVFIFDDEELSDATSPARELLRAAPPGPTAWRRLVTLLTPRFPSLSQQISDIGTSGFAEILPQSETDAGMIRAEWWDGLVRVELLDKNLNDPEVRVDRQCLVASENELELLRHLSENSPVLTWKTDARGRLTWANSRYMDAASDRGSDVWPPRDLFPALVDLPASTDMHRLEIPGDAGSPDSRWFDCRKTAYGNGFVCFALESGQEVSARATLNEFVQTLSKTFAHLPVGLAVFDRNRQLVIFNPALTDLTGLDVMFLAGKPQFSSFLDKLREKRMIPEPKNYAGWRDHLKALEAGAENGSYLETWSLPSGQTYRISGRPHPNGAIAFQFEDITPEISLTRRFRAELEIGQAVLDTMQTALAVFSPGGILTMSNSAYETLWGKDPRDTLHDITCSDAAARWTVMSETGSLWAKVETSVCQIHNRKPWNDRVRLRDGRTVRAFITPLSGGATLVRFAVENAGPSQNVGNDAPQPETISDKATEPV